jgi:hypothetical protein
MGAALGLFDLECGLNSATCEVRRAHEQQDEIAVLVARESTKHGHERKLVVEVLDGVGHQCTRNSDSGGAQLLHAGNSGLNACSNSRQGVLGALDNQEQLVVRAEASPGDLLHVDLEQCLPHCVRAGLPLNVHALRRGDMRQDVAACLLVLVKPQLEASLVVLLSLGIGNALSVCERCGSALG